MWLAETEGARFWLAVLTELKSRGLQDLLIACVDGLKGFPEAIAAEYPVVLRAHGSQLAELRHVEAYGWTGTSRTIWSWPR